MVDQFKISVTVLPTLTLDKLANASFKYLLEDLVHAQFPEDHSGKPNRHKGNTFWRYTSNLNSPVSFVTLWMRVGLLTSRVRNSLNSCYNLLGVNVYTEVGDQINLREEAKNKTPNNHRWYLVIDYIPASPLQTPVLVEGVLLYPSGSFTCASCKQEVQWVNFETHPCLSKKEK